MVMHFRRSHLSERVDTIAYTAQGVREAVHQMVQEEAQGPEWETSPIQQENHTQEEGHHRPMVQEEHNPQEEESRR